MMLGLITPSSGEIFIDGVKLISETRIKLLIYELCVTLYRTTKETHR